MPWTVVEGKGNTSKGIVVLALKNLIFTRSSYDVSFTVASSDNHLAGLKRVFKSTHSPPSERSHWML
jgi:hypothetical protein